MHHIHEIETAIVAQIARPPAVPPVDTSGKWYYLGLVLLLVALIAAAVTAYRFWEDMHDVEEPDTPADLLEAFKEARAAGELDEQEFERVRRRLGQAAGPEWQDFPKKPPTPPS